MVGFFNGIAIGGRRCHCPLFWRKRCGKHAEGDSHYGCLWTCCQCCFNDCRCFFGTADVNMDGYTIQCTAIFYYIFSYLFRRFFGTCYVQYFCGYLTGNRRQQTSAILFNYFFDYQYCLGYCIHFCFSFWCWCSGFCDHPISVFKCLSLPGVIDAKQGVLSFRTKKGTFHKKHLGMILRFGIPSGIQNSIIAIANVVVQSNINAFGEMAMAGCRTYSKIEGFAFLPITSFTMALTTFVGQNSGAKEYERTKKRSFLWG